MSCYHPLVIKQVGVDRVTGKPKTVMSKLMPGMDTTGCAIVPCGQCIGCRIDYSRQWADRCILESMDHESSYFLTLTYDNQHLDSIEKSFVDFDGNELKIYSLNKKDFSKFIKDLRQALVRREEKRLGRNITPEERPKIRFFGCGEYGSVTKTMRPHLHIIVFGLKLTDLVLDSYNKLNQPLYTSEFIDGIWKNGRCVIGAVNWNTCAYVARYVTKKIKGEGSALYDIYHYERPFTLMSRKPGIGAGYYKKHPEMFDYTYVTVPTDDGPRKIYPGRFYRHMLELDNPKKFEIVREKAQVSSEISWNSKILVSDLDMVDQLKVDESLFNDRIRILERKGV